MRRCKMRLIWWFPDWWKNFLGFLDILEETRIRFLEFGDHRTKFEGPCMVQTQDLRKSMFFTWIINKSVFKRFLGEIRPWRTFTSHNQPSLEIWFETEHFEILSFSDPELKFLSITYWAWNGSRQKLSWIFSIFQAKFNSTRRDEQNPEIISKSEKFGFLANFVSKHCFCKNRGKVGLTQCF